MLTSFDSIRRIRASHRALPLPPEHRCAERRAPQNLAVGALQSLCRPNSSKARSKGTDTILSPAAVRRRERGGERGGRSGSSTEHRVFAVFGAGNGAGVRGFGEIKTYILYIYRVFAH